MQIHPCLLSIFLIVIFEYNGVHAQLQIGQCGNIDHGKTKTKCEMRCNNDGSCEETRTEESCDCNGNSQTAIVTDYYQDGEATYSLGRRKKRQADVCGGMSRRCSDCRNRRGGGSAQFEQTSYDGCSGQRRNGGFNRGSGSSGGSFGGSGGNGGSFGGSGGGDRTFTRGSCQYTCKGNIRGDGTCQTRQGGKMGSCFGDNWGGACSGEPSGCNSCSNVC